MYYRLADQGSGLRTWRPMARGLVRSFVESWNDSKQYARLSFTEGNSHLREAVERFFKVFVLHRVLYP
jgi:hypothetical protein